MSGCHNPNETKTIQKRLNELETRVNVHTELLSNYVDLTCTCKCHVSQNECCDNCGINAKYWFDIAKKLQEENNNLKARIAEIENYDRWVKEFENLMKEAKKLGLVHES